MTNKWFLFFCFLLPYCTPPSIKRELKLRLIDPTVLEFVDETTVQGTGRILLEQPLFHLESKELYFIQAELSHKNSSLILYSHFSDFTIQDGIKVFLERQNNDFILSVSTPGYKREQLNMIPDYFLKNQSISLHLEVHNGTKNFINVKIWDTYINPTDYLKISAPFFSTQNQLADSSGIFFYSKGRGLLWGVELKRAKLIHIKRESPNRL